MTKTNFALECEQKNKHGQQIARSTARSADCMLGHHTASSYCNSQFPQVHIRNNGSISSMVQETCKSSRTSIRITFITGLT
ncbi:hypothetical protein E2C01_036351 [Portunus trituberculatus]|uniref:Uncharacterized protein n=1 Tax=Portunus trituberculatus TaxID=210409 RepID=A0A5B7FDZ1_PORTR|nr:hypothetical protein [Portunus trituberculatus]